MLKDSFTLYIWYSYIQVYANEVGFDGTSEAFLTYSYLDTVTPPNSPLDFDQNSENQMTVMSLSFYPQRAEGIMLVFHNEVQLIYTWMSIATSLIM